MFIKPVSLHSSILWCFFYHKGHYFLNINHLSLIIVFVYPPRPPLTPPQGENSASSGHRSQFSTKFWIASGYCPRNDVLLTFSCFLLSCLRAFHLFVLSAFVHSRFHLSCFSLIIKTLF
jgi:hypothetical protein